MIWLSEENGPNSKGAVNTTHWKQLLQAKATQVGERLGRASFEKLPTALAEGIRELAVGIEVGITQESQARMTENLNALTARADGIQKRMDIRADNQDRSIETKLMAAEKSMKSQADALGKTLKEAAATDYAVLRQESQKARESAGAANTSAMAAGAKADGAEAAAKKASETVASFTSQIAALEDVDDNNRTVRGASALGVIAARVRAVQARLSDIDTIFESLAPLMRAWKEGIIVDGKKMDLVQALNHVLANSANAAKSAAESAQTAKDAREFLLEIQHNLSDGVDTANKRISEVADTVQRLSMAPPPLSAAPVSSPVSSPPSSGVKEAVLETGSVPAGYEKRSTPVPAAPEPAFATVVEEKEDGPAPAPIKRDTPAPPTSSSPVDSWAPVGLPLAQPAESAAAFLARVPSATRTMVPVSGIPPAEDVRFPAPPRNPSVNCPAPENSIRRKGLPSPMPEPVVEESAGISGEAESTVVESEAKPLSIQESAKQRFDAADSTIAAIIDMARKKGKIDDAYDEAVDALKEDLKMPSLTLDGDDSNGVFDARVQLAFFELDARARTLARILDVDESLQEKIGKPSYDDSETDQEKRIDRAFDSFAIKMSKLWHLNSFESEPLSMSGMGSHNNDSKVTGGVS